MLVSGAAQAISFPLGTYIYAGSVKNYKGEVMTSDMGVTVQAVNSNGVVLASSPIADPQEATGYANYRLEVPLATVASDKTAAVGDELTCVVVSGTGVSLSVAPFPAIAEANAITNVNLMYATMTSYTYGTGTVSVADSYVEGIAYLMSRYAQTSTYDAAADWDNDGVDNYKEYLAGTNPFDETDSLRITEMQVNATVRQVALKFEYKGQRIYALKASETLTDPAWKQERFKFATSESAERTEIMVNANEEDVGIATLYVTPAVDAASGFYKVEVK